VRDRRGREVGDVGRRGGERRVGVVPVRDCACDEYGFVGVGDEIEYLQSCSLHNSDLEKKDLTTTHTPRKNKN
jgi:hypothetical protein